MLTSVSDAGLDDSMKVHQQATSHVQGNTLGQNHMSRGVTLSAVGMLVHHKDSFRGSA